MYSEQIAEYFASVKFKPDTASLKKVDQFFSIAEKRIARVVQRIEKQDVMGGLFKVNNAKLASQLNKSLNAASKTTVFTITNFRIDQSSLQSSLQQALNRARTSVTISPNVTRVPRTPSTGGGGTVRPKGSFINDTVRNSSFRGMGTAWHGALAGGGILTGFGLRAYNQQLRELEQMPVALQAVTGSEERAQSELAFLRGLSREVATPTRTIAPEYSKFLASAMGTPLESKSHDMFTNILKYGKVVGMDEQAVKGTLKAITQISNKQRVYMEELECRLAA